MTTYTLNPALNGIELKFDAVPGDIILKAIKEAGFHWHRAKKIWYAKHSDERLELAQKLANAKATITEEAKTQEKSSALTVEKMNSLSEGYGFHESGSGLYSGWTGDNACKVARLSGADKKPVILAELKKCGIKATARQHRGGYTTHYTFTIYTPSRYFLTEDEYVSLEKLSVNKSWYTRPDGSSIHRDALFDLPQEEIDEIKDETLRREYRVGLKNQNGFVVKSEFKKLVYAIVESFNSNHSNSMIDYFDVGFYADYSFKAV